MCEGYVGVRECAQKRQQIDKERSKYMRVCTASDRGKVMLITGKYLARNHVIIPYERRSVCLEIYVTYPPCLL